MNTQTKMQGQTRAYSANLVAHVKQSIPNLKILTKAVALSFAIVTPHVQAQVQSSEANKVNESIIATQKVVISGTRYEQFLENLAMSIELIDQAEIERLAVGDIRDLAKNYPNIHVKRAPARFTVTGVGNPTGRDANAGFSIRGQDGNRVLMLIDGVRLPRSYINGSNAFGRDSIAMDLIKQVEIIRGPASVLYGSDGLAGLVNFISLEPEDLLKKTQHNGNSWGGKLSTFWNSDDQSRGLNASLAGRINPELSWLISANRSQAHELRNQGRHDVPNIDRTTPNPQTDKNNSTLIKLSYRANAQQKHVLSLEHVEKTSDIELLSSRAKLPLANSSTNASAVIGENAHRTMNRKRISLLDRYTLDHAWIDHVQTNFAYQQSHAQDNGVTHRNSMADRVRNVSYNEHAGQASIQTDKLVKFSQNHAHKLSLGVDYTNTNISSFFDGVDPGNPNFKPRKYFPDTRDTSRAIFIQDEIFIGQWIVTPGLRHDSFALNVLSQAGFSPPAALSGKSLTGSATVPKLGLLYKLNSNINLYGHSAGGYRAPNAQQINGVFDGGSIPAILLSNPNLKPEKSSNFEFGIRAMHEQFNMDFVVFSGKYKDLIYDKKPLGGKGIAGDPALFQTVNIDQASIRGFEIRSQFELAQFKGGTLILPFSYGHSKGWDDTAHTPLNSINPDKLLTGLRFTHHAYDLQLNLRYQNGKKESDMSSPYLPKPVTPPRVRQLTIAGVSTLDFQSYFRLQKNLNLNLSIENITNRKYWNWSDIQGLAANSTIVDAYTQPGRNFHASLSILF
jgi:hemoglobin/transferrin/lactoferrin receptor protein